MKTWRFLAIFWPILCVIFAVFMGFQSGRTLDSRISGIGFCTIPLIFFAIGMSVRHRLLKERSSVSGKIPPSSRNMNFMQGKRSNGSRLPAALAFICQKGQYRCISVQLPYPVIPIAGCSAMYGFHFPGTC